MEKGERLTQHYEPGDKVQFAGYKLRQVTGTVVSVSPDGTRVVVNWDQSAKEPGEHEHPIERVEPFVAPGEPC